MSEFGTLFEINYQNYFYGTSITHKNYQNWMKNISRFKFENVSLFDLLCLKTVIVTQHLSEWDFSYEFINENFIKIR